MTGPEDQRPYREAKVVMRRGEPPVAVRVYVEWIGCCHWPQPPSPGHPGR